MSDYEERIRNAVHISLYMLSYLLSIFASSFIHRHACFATGFDTTQCPKPEQSIDAEEILIRELVRRSKCHVTGD